MKLSQHAINGLYESGIPYHMHEGLINYIEKGVPAGGFLSAVLTNDLVFAVMRADTYNRHALVNYIEWLHTHAPSSCWGSWENYEAWLARYAGEKQKEPDNG